jgi:hypothetical protein
VAKRRRQTFQGTGVVFGIPEEEQNIFCLRLSLWTKGKMWILDGRKKTR